jgi:hypothetical protein
LQHYPELHDELQTRHRLLSSSEHFRAYALR